MVQRYWGHAIARTSDFFHLVDEDQGGIVVEGLLDELNRQGWPAIAFRAESPASVRQHLAVGRPIIALLSVEGGTNHYVVLLALTESTAVFHDPAIGPLQSVPVGQLFQQWSGTDFLAILVLPPPDRDDQATEIFVRRDHPTQDALVSDGKKPSPCSELVDAAIALGASGEMAEAEALLVDTLNECPTFAPAYRELAAVRVLQEDWARAAALAERAVALDPADTHAVRILATSYFLLGDRSRAIKTWNRIGEPHLDLVTTSGLDEIRYDVVQARLGLKSGEVLTDARLARAKRRMADLPAVAKSRVGYRPVGRGLAQLDAAAVTHSSMGTRFNMLGAATRGLVQRELTLQFPGASGRGDLTTISWRWQENRPRLAASVAAPEFLGIPGITRVDASWEREAYAAGSRETRRRGGVDLSDWIDGNTRVNVGAGVARWDSQGMELSVGGGLSRRILDDHGVLSTSFDLHAPLGSRDGFAEYRFEGTLNSSPDPFHRGLRFRAGYQGVGATAPRLLWPGAGTGLGRDPLLRAHDLLKNGVIAGDAFGRSLAFGTLEGQVFPFTVGAVRLGLASFADFAKAWNRPDGRGTLPWQVDVGIGLRLHVPGSSGQLRIDAATGLRGGDQAISVGWRSHLHSP